MLRWWKKRCAARATPAETSLPPSTSPHSTDARATVSARSLPTFKFDTSRVTADVKADLRRNIEELADIEPQHRVLAYEIALRAILAGGDIGLLSRELRLAIDMAARRAGEVSRSLVIKATTLMDVEQCLARGFTKSIWHYAGATCGTVEQDAAHAAVDGEVYETAKGLIIPWSLVQVQHGLPILPRVECSEFSSAGRLCRAHVATM
jgi:hypothetical protein